MNAKMHCDTLAITQMVVLAGISIPLSNMKGHHQFGMFAVDASNVYHHPV
jgi:hypothetical protein